MWSEASYYGGITSEQFLFYEIRTASKLYLDGKSLDEAKQIIKNDNLFQFPTERSVSRMVRSCYCRLDALDNKKLQECIAYAPSSVAKQVNLYAIMRWNLIVWDFMIKIIGSKYKNFDLNFTRKDINTFFSNLQAQNDDVAKWSVSTINKIKSVIIKMLVETEYLDSNKSEILKPVLISEELEYGINQNNDKEALAAFNRF